MGFIFINGTKKDPGLSGAQLAKINSHNALLRHHKKEPTAVDKSRSQSRTAHSRYASPCVVEVGAVPPEAESFGQLTLRTSHLNSSPVMVLKHGHDFDRQLFSVLDPFVRLPTPVSKHEKILLQSFFTNGQRLVFGTGPRPVYIRPIFRANYIHWDSSIHILVHRLIAETMQIQVPDMQKQYSSTFNLRRAEVYQAMAQLIADEDASLTRKLSSLVMVSLLEHTLKRPDLQVQHNEMIDRFMEAHGGMPQLLLECSRSSSDAYADLPWILPYFIPAKPVISNEQSLKAIVRRFRTSLRATREWALSMRAAMLDSEASRRNGPAAPNLDSTTQLHTFTELRRYLNSLIANSVERQDDSLSGSGCVFHWLFPLTFRQVVYNCDAETSRTILSALEDCLSSSSDSTPEDITTMFAWIDEAKKPIVATHLLSLITVSEDCEKMLLQGLVDMLRILPLLSRKSTLQLAQNFASCIFAAIDMTYATFFDEISLDILVDEIVQKWTLHNQEARGRTSTVNSQPYGNLPDGGEARTASSHSSTRDENFFELACPMRFA